MLLKMQRELGAKVYDRPVTVAGDSMGIVFLGVIAYLAVLVLELVMLAGFVAFGFSNPFARESLAILFDPSGLGPWFVVGLVGLGLLVPLAVEVFVTVTKRLVRALPVDLLCIAGGLVLRFCVVWSGMH